VAHTWHFGGLAPHVVRIGHFHEGHFAPDADADVFDLYALWPLVVRTKSALASGLLGEAGDGSVLKRLTAILEGEYLDSELEMQYLETFPSPLRVPIRFLPFLAEEIAAEYAADWPHARSRLLVRSMVLLWRAKGTHPAWRSQLTLRGRSAWTFRELWKRRLHETSDYSWIQDYTHRFKAARADVLDGPAPAEAVSWDAEARAFVQAAIECLRPIHVLLRAPPEELELPPDPMPAACDGACEVYACETSEETGASDGSLESVASDSWQGISDSVEVVPTCVHWCQSSCQTYGCETGGCQSGPCETTCQAYCESHCETSCQEGCETACETDCETGME